jgi:hypothetical protein
LSEASPIGLEPASMRAFFRLQDSVCYIAAGVRDADVRSPAWLLGWSARIPFHPRRRVANGSVLLGTLFGRALLPRRLDPSQLNSRESLGATRLALAAPSAPLAAGWRSVLLGTLFGRGLLARRPESAASPETLGGRMPPVGCWDPSAFRNGRWLLPRMPIGFAG